MDSRQSLRATNHAVDLLQVAESATTSISESLTQMRELASQASQDSLTPTAREALNDAFRAHATEIDARITDAEFSGVELGASAKQSVALALGQDGAPPTATMPDLSVAGLDLAAASLSDGESAAESVKVLDSALKTTEQARASLGSSMGRLSTAIQSGQSFAEATVNAADGGNSLDFTAGISQRAQQQIAQLDQAASGTQAAQLNRDAAAALLS